MAESLPLDLLAIGSHPDDIEISCGGTLAVAARQGFRTGILDLTRGELATNGDPETRAREAAEGARILGVAVRRNAALPDGGIRAGDPEQERRVVALLRALRPEVILTHFPQDRHPDHVEASRLCDRAWYLAGLRQFHAEGAPFRPEARYHFASRIGFHPSLVVDVTEVWETKRSAILAHGSQLLREGTGRTATQLNDPDFLARLEARSRHFGSMIGARHGEPFFSPEPLGVRQLASWLHAARPHPSAFTG